MQDGPYSGPGIVIQVPSGARRPSDGPRTAGMTGRPPEVMVRAPGTV